MKNRIFKAGVTKGKQKTRLPTGACTVCIFKNGLGEKQGVLF